MEAELISIRQRYETKINSMKSALSRLKPKDAPSSFMLAMQSFAPMNNQGGAEIIVPKKVNVKTPFQS